MIRNVKAKEEFWISKILSLLLRVMISIFIIIRYKYRYNTMKWVNMIPNVTPREFVIKKMYNVIIFIIVKPYGIGIVN